MSDVIKRRENCLMVYVPEELDHHFAQQITKVVDEELEKGEISQLVFDFSKTTFMDSSGIGMLMGRDRIHFTKEGYQEQGTLLFRAFMESYNNR